MPKKKAPDENKPKVVNPNVMGLRAEVLEQPIPQTLEINYMPYAMSVIVSRAIPEIDGFKPSHRKLLYTMYQMHLLGGDHRTISQLIHIVADGIRRINHIICFPIMNSF